MTDILAQGLAVSPAVRAALRGQDPTVEQLEAITAPVGPAHLIAGAGSGKTRTLTYRVAYLIEQGIPPDRRPFLHPADVAALRATGVRGDGAAARRLHVDDPAAEATDALDP